MSRFAFVFPGQGSQLVGMGKSVYESSPAARAVFEEADRVLGFSLTKICFEGPEDRLNDTAVAQPAVLTASVALFEALVEKVNGRLGRRATDGSEPRGVMALPEQMRPSFVAGHSLGEFTALVIAGVLPFADALRLVAERGQLASTRGAQGSMAAIIGMSAADVEKVIDSAIPERGRVVVANDNGPAQVTIAGDEEGIRMVAKALERGGARKIVPLRISAPFHFPAMGKIGEDLRSFMSTLRFREPVVPIVANVSGTPHPRASAIPDALVRHLSQRVEWLKSVRFMVEREASTFVEFGASPVVNGLVKRIADVKLVNITDNASIASAIAALRARTAAAGA